jgi:hypothetical protein
MCVATVDLFIKRNRIAIVQKKTFYVHLAVKFPFVKNKLLYRMLILFEHVLMMKLSWF